VLQTETEAVQRGHRRYRVRHRHHPGPHDTRVRVTIAPTVQWARVWHQLRGAEHRRRHTPPQQEPRLARYVPARVAPRVEREY
jgi:hypothetical protein